MRIIAGRWRGHRIKAPRGRDVRPTTDRVREAWMSAIGGSVVGASVLDLFAGSGALGLEALSRGADRVVFVERARGALLALESNVVLLGAQEACRVGALGRASYVGGRTGSSRPSASEVWGHDAHPPGRSFMTPTRPLIALYPGSFDPITRGHEDIARRTLGLADRLIVAVAATASQSKSSLFTLEERLELIGEVFSDEARIECRTFEGLLVDFARDVGARFVIRGLRAVSDFEYEFQMAQMNRELWSDIETLFLTPDLHYSFLSASLVRQVAALGGDVTPFVSAPVLRRLEKKLG